MAFAQSALIPASYVYLLADGKVLLQQRRNTGYMDGLWTAGAAGHIEPGETARQCAVREAVEELGVHIEGSDLHLATVMQRTDGSDTPCEQRVDWFWTASTWRGDPRIVEPHKAGACGGSPWTTYPSKSQATSGSCSTDCVTAILPATPRMGTPESVARRGVIDDQEGIR